MALVAFQRKKGISVHCRQIGHKLQATHASSPFSIAQQHRRAHRHPAISRFVARQCGHAALLSHSCLGVCERCCSLIFFWILFISYLSHAALSLAVSRCTLSPCLSTQAARQQAWRARLAERGHGAWAALAAVRGGSAPACGAVVWREARRLDGRCSSFFLLHGDPAGRSVTRRRQAGGCSRRSEAAPGSLTCMRSGAAASAQQRLGRALQSRGGGGGPWPTAGRRRCEESGPTRRAGRGAANTFQICLVSVYATA